MTHKHKLQTQWLVQAMKPGRMVAYTQSRHTTLAGGQKGLAKATKAYPLSNWRLVKEREIQWWPR